MSLYHRLKEGAGRDWRAYVEHDFVKQLADGSLPEACFRHYLIQDYLFLIQFARAYGLAAYKASDLEDIRAASAALGAIVDTEIKLHIEFCAGWGLSEADMASAPEAAETMAYTRYVLDRGMAGDLLDLHVALAPCIVGYAEIGKGIGEVADDHPYKAWIEMYASADYEQVAADEIGLIDSLFERTGSEARVADLQRTFGKATRLEADFWQMGLDAAA